MLLVRTSSNRLPEKEYVLDVVLRDGLGLDYTIQSDDGDATSILLADDHSGSFVSTVDEFFSMPDDQWLRPGSLPRLPLVTIKGDALRLGAGGSSDHLHVIFGRPNRHGGFLSVTHDRIELGIDLFGSIFFMLTRYEELADPALDRHGRFPATQSLAGRAGFLERPLVDEYIELLWRCLHRLFPHLERRPREPRIILSHDVDLPLMHGDHATWRSTFARSWAEFRGRRPRAAGRRLASYAAVRSGKLDRDPYNTFDAMMSTAEDAGLASSFNFMTGVSHGSYDPGYDVEHPFIQELLHAIHGRGHEIGFHPSYLTAGSPERTRREFEAFRTMLDANGIPLDRFGGRQHFLRWVNPKTWRHWEAIGAAYDSSLGYADRLGFRCGTCRPFQPFDLVERRPLELIEQPLIAMDTTLFNYLGLSEDEATAKLLELRETCRRHDGDLTLLVHNSSLATSSRRRWFRETVATLAG